MIAPAPASESWTESSFFSFSFSAFSRSRSAFSFSLSCFSFNTAWASTISPVSIVRDLVGSGHGHGEPHGEQAPRGPCHYMERVGLSGRPGYRWKALGELSRRTHEGRAGHERKNFEPAATLRRHDRRHTTGEVGPRWSPARSSSRSQSISWRVCSTNPTASIDPLVGRFVY